MREQYAIKCSIFTIYNFSASSSTRFGLECVQLVNHISRPIVICIYIELIRSTVGCQGIKRRPPIARHHYHGRCHLHRNSHCQTAHRITPHDQVL